MFGEKRKYIVDEKLDGMRLDMAIVALEPDLSRQYVQKLIHDKRVYVEFKVAKASHIVCNGQKIMVNYPVPVKIELEPVSIPIKIVYEDKDLIVIDKNAGMVVHPGANGQFVGETLVNAVLAHLGDDLKAIGGTLRPGIVHRLDKDTSGLIIIAKNNKSHLRLSEAFKDRKVDKFYYALVVGRVSVKHGVIDLPIGRSENNRKLMAVYGLNSKEANTEYWVQKYFLFDGKEFTLLKVKLHSGRTHQIRVHFSAINYPLVGDQQYGRKTVNALFEKNFLLKRQFLHAFYLKFIHPTTKKTIKFSIDLPSDLLNVLCGMTDLGEMK